MPTAIIADDEAHLSAELVSRLTRFWPELEIVAVVHNGVDALAELNARQPDFAFLDIRMPGVDGLHIAQLVPDIRVVFVTAYDEHAAHAFDLSAADYLLKPLSDERLLRCIARLQREGVKRSQVREVNDTVGGEKSTPIQWLTVGGRDTTRLVSINDVIYFKATDKYTEIITRGDHYFIRTSLKDLLPRLDIAKFAQIHRSVIVAYIAIDRVERDMLGRLRVHLHGIPDILPVSRGFVGLFRQM